MISARGQWILAAAFAVVVLFILAVRNGSDTPQKRIEKISSACAEQYGPGTEAAQRCEIAILASKMRDDDRARMREAARRSGL